ncbi:hypothetical protein DES49_0516 [Halospina denitrificans]|uniref:Uncharacterized protein n=1 Tax=Halospina denitrificans TaxID=332522 RepID=A0A4R7K214_9GAMM|nr:hypothetical protein [Halospina denitrificans]TDT44414.1 hypothetical protein DES49_0516 [Halospina denitrificans]
MINTAVAAGTQAGRERLNGFQKAVADYQKALLDLRDRMKTDTGPGRGARLAKLRQNARVAFQNLNEQYATELDRYAPEAFRAKNRGTALSNAKRGITLAERSAGSAKVDPHLQVTDMIQASRIRYLAGALNVLGRIAPVADAGLRTHKVTSVREEGGEWLRESVAQMTGFGFAGALGGIAGKATYVGGTAIAAKAGLLLVGPVGWAAVGTILLVTAVTGFTAAYYSDQIGQYIAETLWDWSD